MVTLPLPGEMKDLTTRPLAHRSRFASLRRAAIFSTGAIATLNLIIVGSTGSNPLAALWGQLGFGNVAANLNTALFCLAAVVLALCDMHARVAGHRSRRAAYSSTRVSRAPRTIATASRDGKSAMAIQTAAWAAVYRVARLVKGSSSDLESRHHGLASKLFGATFPSGRLRAETGLRLFQGWRDGGGGAVVARRLIRGRS